MAIMSFILILAFLLPELQLLFFVFALAVPKDYLAPHNYNLLYSVYLFLEERVFHPRYLLFLVQMRASEVSKIQNKLFCVYPSEQM